MTATENLPCIAALGLLPVAELARRAGYDPNKLLLRSGRTKLSIGDRTVTLNHQMPLRAGRHSTKTWLENGLGLEDWARQLDARIFLWPTAKATEFKKSIASDIPVSLCSLSTRELIKRMPDAVWVSPINSGNAKRRPAPRGAWLYVSAMDDWNAFADNRRKRGLVSARDNIVEVSLSGPLEPEDLRACGWRIERFEA